MVSACQQVLSEGIFPVVLIGRVSGVSKASLRRYARLDVLEKQSVVRMIIVSSTIVRCMLELR